VPAAGDVTGDGVAEVVVALSDGRLLAVSLEGSAVPLENPKVGGVETGPALLDVDGDGRLDVVLGAKDGQLHAFGPGGKALKGFPRRHKGPVTSVAALGRLGVPPRPSLVVGGEDGKLYAHDLQGKGLEGFPVASGDMISGQPALGDVDGDGYNDGAFASQDFKVYAIGASGKLLPGYPVNLDARLLDGPALADLDKDGRLDIVVGSGDGRVHALRHDGSQVKGFPVKVGDRVIGPVVVGDVDADGTQEVLAASINGQLHVVRANGKPFPGFPARLNGEAMTGPVVFESELGTLVAVGSADSVFAFKLRKTGTATAHAWPQPGHDARHGGRSQPNPPGYAELAVGPVEPRTRSELEIAYRFFDLDGDPEPATEVRWFRNGKEVEELKGNRKVAPAHTKKGERWSFSVAAPGGEPRRSPEALVLNTPPGLPGIAFAALPLRRAGAITVKVTAESPDPDADKIVYRYLWLREGQPQKGRTSATLPPGTVKKGERWSAVVTPFDGEHEGPPAVAEAIVEDSPPTAATVVLTPAKPKTGDAIQVVVQKPATDVDGDELRYRYHFSVDGKPVPLSSSLDTLPAFVAREKQTVHVEVFADDGELLGPGTSVETVVVNTPPTQPTPAATPAEPKCQDTLQGGLKLPAVDADGDPLSYRFTWLRGGKRSEGPHLAGLKRGETLVLEVVANDGDADSPTGQVSVVVGNTPPTVPSIVFEKLPLRIIEKTRVVISQPSTDADGDAVTYSYRWSRNGEVQADLAGPEILPGRTKKGERWQVVVTPHDGKVAGPPAFLETVVVDSTPTAPEVALEPAAPRVAEAIKVVLRKPASDGDGDKLRYRYRYTVDGALLPVADDVDTVAPFTVRKGQTIAVEVVADDGEVRGPVATAQVKVLNTAPRSPHISLLPEAPRRGDRLEAMVVAPAQDDDGDALSYRYQFARNGAVVPVGAAGRLGTELRKGEQWDVQVVASDGDVDSPPTRATVKVRNTPPSRPVVAFERLPLRVIEPVRIKILEPATDPDGDRLTYAYAWSKNAQPQPQLTGPELPAGTAREGEVWTVAVSASDGEESGAAAKLKAVVANSAPTAPVVELAPAQARAGDEIRVVVKTPATDPDGDKLRYRYRFFVNGMPLPKDDAEDKVAPLTARKGETVRVEVRADDGDESGPLAEASVTLQNTPPKPPTVSLRPEEPKRGDALQAAIAKMAEDIDQDVLSYRFVFTKAGRPVAGQHEGREVVDLRKGEVYELVLIANDGKEETVSAKTSVTVRNTPPTAPAVTFAKSQPQSGEAVKVVIDRASTDADGDAMTYAFLYTVNGKPAGLSPDTREIPAGRLKKHEAWSVEVVPSDPEGKGAAGRATLKVRNTAPTRPVVMLDPLEPTALSGVKAKLTTPSTDRDGDAVEYRYLWTVDGVRWPLPASASSIPPGKLKRGQRIELVVTPFDGEVEGAPAEAAGQVDNSSPRPPKVAVQPGKPSVRDALECVISEPATDPDQEPLTTRFTWKRDGVVVPMAPEQSTVPAGQARHGEAWSCEVTVTDGALSASVVASATVANSPPSAPTVTVEPQEPRAGDDLICRTAKLAEDPDGDPLEYAFKWMSGSKALTPAPGKPWVLPSSALRKGQTYRCEVTASDGSLAGPGAQADARYRNSAPKRALVRLTPAQPSPESSLTCEVAEAATDPDGDRVQYRFGWWKNGVEQSFAGTSAQVPARLLKAGDIWRCAVTPTDGENDGPLVGSDEVVVKEPARASRE